MILLYFSGFVNACTPKWLEIQNNHTSTVYQMQCQAVMHDYISVKMPKKEKLGQVRKIRKVLKMYFAFLFL